MTSLFIKDAESGGAGEEIGKDRQNGFQWTRFEVWLRRWSCGVGLHRELSDSHGGLVWEYVLLCG